MSRVSSIWSPLLSTPSEQHGSQSRWRPFDGNYHRRRHLQWWRRTRRWLQDEHRWVRGGGGVVLFFLKKKFTYSKSNHCLVNDDWCCRWCGANNCCWIVRAFFIFIILCGVELWSYGFKVLIFFVWICLGAYVANRASDKITQLTDNVYVCRSGSVSSTLDLYLYFGV